MQILFAQRRAFRNFTRAGKFFRATYDKKTIVGRGIERAGGGFEQARSQPVVDVEPGGAGFVPGTVAARLAEPVSQRRGHFARGVGLRTARAFAGSGFPGARPRRAAKFRVVSQRDEHVGAQERAGTAPESGRLFFRRVRFPRVAADFGGRPRHPVGRPHQIRERPRSRLCGHQPVLPRGLFPAGD